MPSYWESRGYDAKMPEHPDKIKKRNKLKKTVVWDLSNGLGGIQLDYAMMLVNEAETAWRVKDPDLEFTYVMVAVQPSVSQLVERLTVDL